MILWRGRQPNKGEFVASTEDILEFIFLLHTSNRHKYDPVVFANAVKDYEAAQYLLDMRSPQIPYLIPRGPASGLTNPSLTTTICTLGILDTVLAILPELLDYQG